MNEPNPLYAELTRLREELKSALALSSQDHASMLAALGESMRLREELLQCRSKLALAAESAAGDGELIAELLAALVGLNAHARPSNWDELDDEYAEQSCGIIAAWKALDAAITKATP